MKMKLTTDEMGYVTIAYDDTDWKGNTRVSRTFMCPPDGGYVREHQRDGDWRQVCDKLYGQGSTLMAPSRDALPEVIRREYRAMRRADKAED